jgi:hypothetical protein
MASRHEAEHGLSPRFGLPSDDVPEGDEPPGTDKDSDEEESINLKTAQDYAEHIVTQ